MKSVVLNILDESKAPHLLGLLRDLNYVEIRFLGEPAAAASGVQPYEDVYAGVPSKLDDDLLQSQLDILEKVDW